MSYVIDTKTPVCIFAAQVRGGGVELRSRSAPA